MKEKLPTGATSNSIPCTNGRTAAEGERQGRQAHEQLNRQLNEQFDRKLPGTGRTPLPQYPGRKDGGL